MTSDIQCDSFIFVMSLQLARLKSPVKKQGQWPEGHLGEMRLKGMSDEEGTGRVTLHGENGLRVTQKRSPGKQGGSWGCTRRSRSWSCAKGENEPGVWYCDEK